MKNLIMITVSLFMFSQTVTATSLHPDTFKTKTYQGFQQLQPSLVTVSSLCPEGVNCVTDGTVIKLNYVYSCAANFDIFSYDVMKINDQLHVFVNAVAGENYGTMVCLAFGTETKTISLPNMFGEVVIHSAGTRIGESRVDNYDLPVAQPLNN